MKRLVGFSTLALMISSTSGCGWLWGEDGYFRDRGNDYVSARATAPMEVPPQYDTRRLDPLLPIPNNVATLQTKDGQYVVPRPDPIPVAAEVSEFSLQTSGASRWLIAQRSPAEVWPLVRQYLSDSRLAVAEERPQVGEFVTDWQSVSQLQGDLAQRLSPILGDQQNRIRIRVEPGVQRNTSEVFVASAQRPADSTADVAFSAAGSAAVNAAVLDTLLASATGNSSSISLIAARDFDAPTRVELTTDGSGNQVLVLQSDFDRAWASVGQALGQSDLRIEDVDRSQGLYFVNLSETAVVPEEEQGFFSGLFGSEADKKTIEERAERYRVRVSQVDRSVQITVEEDVETAAPAEVSRRVLEQLHSRLK